MEKRVSIAMPVYNGERYIENAIRSILAQDYSNIELIITDNESVDATPDICKRYASSDDRITYVRNPRNLGAAPNYNRGFELATGEYLKWFAHDDLISPNYVSACVSALEADPDASLAFGSTICIDPDGNEFDGLDTDETPAILDADPARRFFRAITLGGTCFPIFGVFRMDMLKRSTLHRSYYGSDRALIAEAALMGRVLKVNEAVFYNREHPTRSIRMVDHAERSKWQDTSSTSRTASMEHVSLVRHLFEIAGRHPETVSPIKARLEVARFASKPIQLGRLSLDFVRYFSPNLAAKLRGSAPLLRRRSADVS